eukprot:363116-Chlamydomonas_euryale.AAC.8
MAALQGTPRAVRHLPGVTCGRVHAPPHTRRHARLPPHAAAMLRLACAMLAAAAAHCAAGDASCSTGSASCSSGCGGSSNGGGSGSGSSAGGWARRSILVVGSVNVDVTMQVRHVS